MNKERLNQIKMDAHSARALYRIKLSEYNKLKNIYMLISVVGSISFLGALYISHGTILQGFVEIISSFMSIGTIIYAVITLLYKYDDNIILCKNGIRNNTFISAEVDSALSEKKNEKELYWFYKFVFQVDTEDNDFFSNIKDHEKQVAYRIALMETSTSKSINRCPTCRKSPWDFVKGDCQLCGNNKN